MGNLKPLPLPRAVGAECVYRTVPNSFRIHGPLFSKRVAKRRVIHKNGIR